MSASNLPTLDMPHWARYAVNATRQELRLPPAITDREIYGVLVSCGPNAKGRITATNTLRAAAESLR